MSDDSVREPVAGAAGTPRRRRLWQWVLAALLVLVAAGGVAVWRLTRPPAPVSVSDVVNRFRGDDPSGPAHSGGPQTGVYVYATDGWERVSTGNVTHHYPASTTLTVTDIACGLRFRWDALAGRYAQLDVCRTAGGWQLQHYVDSHKFLYVQDVHDYACSGFPSVVCRTESGDVLTSTVEPVSAGHVRVTQEATGKSLSVGVIEAWLLPNGLPRRVTVEDTGSQTVLGAKVTYTESAEFTLTSSTPLR